MPGETSAHGGLAAATHAATNWEASLIRAKLAEAGIEAFVPDENSSEMLWHLRLAINRQGVQVWVRPGDVEAAKNILAGEGPSLPAADQRVSEGQADAYARRAALSALFAWLFPPLVLWTFYCGLRALLSARKEPPADQSLFHRNVWASAILAAAGAFAGALLCWGVLANRL